MDLAPTIPAVQADAPLAVDEELSDYWGHLDGDELGAAVLDKFNAFREWCRLNGLIATWNLKLHYYYNEYRVGLSADRQHVAGMQQFGNQGEYFFVSLNMLRSNMKTILGSVVQNPPKFTPKAVNSDASAKEAARLYDGVLDYYVRTLKLGQKLNKAAELGAVVDQGFMMIEWDPFASKVDDPGSGIWKGNINPRLLAPWDVAYDTTRASWNDLDWVIVRDWVPRQKVLAQFPEFRTDIKASQNRGDVMTTGSEYEPATRYSQYQNASQLSDDIQVFKLFYRDTPWQPRGRFAMFLENGKMLFESPVGLVYPTIPVERFVPDEQVDVLLGYSPINELVGLQEAVNTEISGIVTNANNHALQYVIAPVGSQLNPKSLDGSALKLLEYPLGGQPPAGLNLTDIPPVHFQLLKEMLGYMQTIPGVSNVSKGESPGANSTGAGMLFLASQTNQNAGQMTTNYGQFCADVMTLMLHVLRTFARTERTIEIMGNTVASRTIVLSEGLKDFDEVVVDLGNPMLNTPQGKLALAQQLYQYGQGEVSPADMLQVAMTGSLGSIVDPELEEQFEIDKENDWLMQGDQVLVNALDDHAMHVKHHKRLLNTPEFRNQKLADTIGKPSDPQTMQGIMNHIQEHMKYQQQQSATAAITPPGHPSAGLNKTLPSPDAAPNAPVQGQAAEAGTALPAQPGQPEMPKAA